MKIVLTSSSVHPLLLIMLPRYLKEWFPSKCDWVVVLRVGFHDPCLASVDVESCLC